MYENIVGLVKMQPTIAADGVPVTDTDPSS